MGKTIRDITVTGRNIQEVMGEIKRWTWDNKIKIVEENPYFVKGRIGLPGGLGLTAPKYFEISLRQGQGCVLVHTEGYIGVYGVSQSSFSPKAIAGGIPRRQGWKVIENLWYRLGGMSVVAQQQPPIPQPQQQAPVQYQQVQQQVPSQPVPQPLQYIPPPQPTQYMPPSPYGAPMYPRITAKPIIGGVLLIIGGILNIILGVWLGFILGWCIIIFVIFAIFAIIGSICAFMRKMWTLALVCSIISIFGMGGWLSIIGTILIALSKDEFDMGRGYGYQMQPPYPQPQYPSPPQQQYPPPQPVPQTPTQQPPPQPSTMPTAQKEKALQDIEDKLLNGEISEDEYKKLKKEIETG